MVIGIIGENCSGKSTLAENIKEEIGAEIISGKDYLRLAKSENDAVLLFKEKLENAVSGDNVIYVISEKEQLCFLPEGAIKILVVADIETIKERFKQRMRGNLPKPVEQMLERKHGMFDDVEYDFKFDGTSDNALVICKKLKQLI